MTQMQGAPAGSMPTDGRWGWYKDHEGNEFQRVSTLIKKVETDRYHLDLYLKRQVLIGAGRRDDLVLAVKSMRPDPVYGWTDRQKKEINALVEKAEEAAKDLDGAVTGTAVHTLTERLDRGESIESVVQGLPPQAELDLRAYAALIELNGWRVAEIERTVVNDDLGVAGTFDRVYVIPGLAALLGNGDCQYGHGDHGPGGPMGELAVIGDVKTEKDPTKNGLHIGPQLAIYSRAKRMWIPEGPTTTLNTAYGTVSITGRYVPAPCVRQDVAVVVHVRNGHAVPHFVNLAEGWEAAQAAKAQAGREKRAGMWLAPMPNIKEPPPAAVVTATAAHQDYANPNRTPALTGLGAAVLPQPWHDAVNTDCPNCASLVASTTRVDGTYADENCHQCGKTAIPRPDSNTLPINTSKGPVTVPAEEVAVLNQQTGMVTWERVGTTTGLDDVDKSAVEAIWAANSVSGPEASTLSAVYQIYTETCGRQWGGRVAEAANARRRQIECPQRALHTTPSDQAAAKCACGWMTGIPA